MLKAVSAVRLREEQELPQPTDKVGLVRCWREVFFPQELSVAVEHSVQLVGGARHWLPWIYPESYNHGIHVVILLGSPFSGRPSPLKCSKIGLTCWTGVVSSAASRRVDTGRSGKNEVGYNQ